MAATGKTPILLYGSTTATNAPTAGNLTNSSDGCEIAINVADKNLFFKDSTNTVNTVPIRQSSASSNGWLSSTDWSTFNGKQAALVSGTNIKTVSGKSLLGSGDVGTIGTSYGGTGLTSFTSGGVVYASSTSALATGSTFVTDGTNVGIGTAVSANNRVAIAVNTANGSGISLINSNNSSYFTFQVNGSTGSGVTDWANSTVLESVPASTGGLVLSSYSGSVVIQTGARAQSSRFFPSGGVSIGNTTDPGAGNFTINGATATKASGTTWANPSDIRLKENIQDFTKGLVELLQINPCTWEYNGKGGTTAGTKGIGVIADDVENILPESVDTYMARLDNEYEEPVKRFDATEITWLLVNAVKQLSYEISVLKGNK